MAAAAAAKKPSTGDEADDQAARLDVGVPLEASEAARDRIGDAGYAGGAPGTETYADRTVDEGYVGGAPGTETYADRTGDAGGTPGTDTYADRSGDVDSPPDNAFGQPTDPRNP